MKLAVHLLVSLAACSAFAEVDLTPRRVLINQGGFEAQRIYFVDGDKKFAVGLSRDAEVSAEENGTLFRFGGLPLATVRLRPSPLVPDVPFDAGGLVQYQKAALRLLPPSAENVVLDETAAEPIPLNNWKSVRLTFSYLIAGAPIRESFVFLNLNGKQQVILQTGAKQKDFVAASERAWKIIRGWHQVLPEDDKGET
jgi:hypothetical protein